MKELTTTCPHCSAAVQYPAAYAGRELKCYACDKEFTAPNIFPASGSRQAKHSSEKEFNFGDPPPKFDHSKHEEVESEPTEETDKTGYSLKVTTDEPIFHRFCRRIGWVAFIGACLSLFCWLAFSSEDRLNSFDYLTWFSDLAWLSFILFGSGQIIKFFHAIAFNTQEMRKKKGDE
tara:strand:+ start:534 stop:1061 length:528 start_codon:yes stop_codon:yes gene_type:complete